MSCKQCNHGCQSCNPPALGGTLDLCGTSSAVGSVGLNGWAECFPELEEFICDETCDEYVQLEASLKRATLTVDATAFGSNYPLAVYTKAMHYLAVSECGSRMLGVSTRDAAKLYREEFERIQQNNSVMPIIF